MILMKLCWFLLTAGLTVFYVLYIDNLALILLICAILLPVILKFCLLWLKFTSHASLHTAAATCTVNDDVPVSVMIESRCPLFFPKAHAFVRVRHTFSDKSETMKLRFPLHGNNTTKLTFYVKPECCGMIQISLEKVKVLDYFYLFQTKLKKQAPQMEILVLPQKTDIMLNDAAPAVDDPEGTHYADRPGDDPSETFNIREYQPGDAVSRIHWKLSSKSDKIFIREFGRPISKQVLLIAEYLPDAAEDGIGRMKQAQAFLTMFYSLTEELSQMPQISFVLAWYDNQQERLIYQPLHSPEMLPELFRKLIHALNHIQLDAQALHDDTQLYSSVTLLTNDPSGELLPVLERQTDAAQKNLLVITEQPPPETSGSVTLLHIAPEQLREHIPTILI